jgi:hypothetical protein
MLALGLAAGTAWGQNISTSTTSSTVGSTTFGFVPTVGNITTFMQATPGSVTCDSTGAVKTCTTTNYQKVVGLPGSFTNSPNKVVSTTPDFACGPGIASAGVCPGLNIDPQTAGPDTTTRQITGTLTSTITLGDGLAGMPSGSISFTLDPSNGNATIDQLISQTVDMAGQPMTFLQRDRTVGYGNPITGPLVPFVAVQTAAGLPAGGTGLVSQTFLDQKGEGGFGALTTDVIVNFPVSGSNPGVLFPIPASFLTPGLNTGVGDGNQFP